MKTDKARLAKKFRSNRSGLLVFGGLSLATILFLAVSRGAVSVPLVKKPSVSSGQVQISGKLSQKMLVQGGQNTVYMDVSIKAPAMQTVVARQRATDMVIVLDRSGSMSGSQKMPYAKAAIRNVLSRLNNQDRFALVSFANHAVIHSPLTAVTSSRREELDRIVNAIHTGGGTNMGAGLSSALGLVSGGGTQRVRKVLLLSDGHANQGISSFEGLSQMASDLTRQEAVLSSVGLGLDFNELLLTRLADQGMGHYAYLEDLSGLGQILSDDLSDTRNIYANSSHLELNLDSGVKLLDAGGYPVTRVDSSTVRIATGQLLANGEKHFVMTFTVPNANTGAVSLGDLNLTYKIQGQELQSAIQKESLMLAVVEPERRQEAVKSIDNDVYKQSWLKNNLGRMQKKLSQWVREGKKDKAEKAIYDYRAAVKEAEEESNVPLASTELDDRLNEMQSRLEETFSGSRQDQEVKRKRAAKSIQMGAIKEQRSVKK